MKTYHKPFLPIEKLLTKLIRRGLKIDVPKSQASDFFSAVNYYRFTGYALPFMKTRTRFASGTRFSTIRELCLFDRKVRDLMFEALEIVEPRRLFELMALGLILQLQMRSIPTKPSIVHYSTPILNFNYNV